MCSGDQSAQSAKTFSPSLISYMYQPIVIRKLGTGIVCMYAIAVVPNLALPLTVFLTALSKNFHCPHLVYHCPNGRAVAAGTVGQVSNLTTFSDNGAYAAHAADHPACAW